MTARTIEGENPLYLSQAKIYIGSTAIGPDITPAWLAPTPAEMKIKARILRGAAVAWEAETSLAAGDVVEIDVAGIGKLTNPVEVIPERR